MRCSARQYSTRKFNKTAASRSPDAEIAVSGLSSPAVSRVTEGKPNAGEQELSLEIAVILMATYILSVVSTLKTHKHLYAGGHGDDADDAIGTEGWSIKKGATVLLIATAFVAVMSEFLVGAVQATAKTWGMTEVFVGVILVAIIGNAAEHSTAILMALKNKMDIAVNLAVGSSIQIALFVAPLLVFLSYAIGPRPMDLIFTSFEVVAIALSVFIIRRFADGESNWMRASSARRLRPPRLAFFFLPA